MKKLAFFLRIGYDGKSAFFLRIGYDEKRSDLCLSKFAF